MVTRPRQSGEQGLRRGLRGRVRPPALGLRQPGLRHRAASILSAQAKADVADHDAYHAALKAANFPTVRGSFRFGNNQHPIQTFYAREVVKRDDGVVTNKIVGTAFEDHVDAYAAECPLP